ncbi:MULTISPECIES: inorganic diphosphatase [unclassified Pedobacter]|uniref:inorganic diphosphatase n=1 Tax=unclassified Pedobacter TaxID=2628915 RepID=UPI001E373C6E|nr:MULTISPECIES: inorganic diphosphatase [unclassified Pedobacter]
MMDRLVQAIIESPKGSRQKFDYEPKSNIFILSKLLPAGMVFPFDFGFLPGTVGEDGDPLDIVVISELKNFTGCAVECRIIGGIKAQQRERNGKTIRNDRFIAIANISTAYAKINSLKDLPSGLLTAIEEFFVNYNKQAEKSFDILGHIQTDQAFKLIEKSYGKNPDKQKLIQLFLPFTDLPSADTRLKTLEQLLIKKFGGLSIYAHQPVLGKWQDQTRLEKDKMIVFEVMVALFDKEFWKAIKSKLEKQFHQKEILIRVFDIAVI